MAQPTHFPSSLKSGCLGSCPEVQSFRLWLGLPQPSQCSPTLVAIGAALGGWLLLLFFLSLDASDGPGDLLSFRKSYWNWTCCHF